MKNHKILRTRSSRLDNEPKELPIYIYQEFLFVL